MYQVSIDLGKSSGMDVSFLQVSAATGLGQGKVALLIGENTGLHGGAVLKYCAKAIDALNQELVAHSTDALRNVLIDPATDKVTTAAAMVGSETEIGATIVLASANATRRSLLVQAGLQQCLEVARETLNAGGSTIVP